MGDVQKIANDPTALIEIAAGPPAPSLHSQKPGENLEFGKQYSDKVTRFIFKKAHMANDDFRIFGADGRLVCNAWHEGKNPYEALDPLGLGHSGPKEEWESLCRVNGYNGMPGFKIKPKMFSKHGRQYIQSWDNHTVFMNVANQSRLKTMSLRHHVEICKGADGDTELEVLVDMSGRTMQFVNKKKEQVAFVQKSMKALIMTAALGAGSEMIIDVAAGFDWTVILAAMMGIQQLGAHFVKDVANNYVMPQVQDAALDATGLGGVADAIGHQTDGVINNIRWGQNILNKFYNS